MAATGLASPGGPLRRQAVARRRCRTPAHRGRLRSRRRVRPRQRLLAHPGVQLPGTLPLRHPRPSEIVCRIPALSLAGRFRAAPPMTRAGLGRFAALPQGWVHTTGPPSATPSRSTTREPSNTPRRFLPRMDRGIPIEASIHRPAVAASSRSFGIESKHW
jgi:hypothetical protein